MPQIFPIVEGKGDALALPILVRRILQAQGAADRVRVRKAAREIKSTLLKPGELERIARSAMRKANDARVLVLIDADDDCAATRGPELQRRLDKVLGYDISAAVVAVREYENWLIAGASAFSGNNAFRDSIRAPRNPESVRDAKQWLNARRTGKHSYDPVVDQEPLTSQVDVETVRQHCRSFDKLWREIARLAH